MIESMFHLPLPVLEKILRPMIVYLCLILFLRLFGKRELAQLNPFDLVVLLSLSNTVQNAMIGEDNSVSGGVIGAFSLLAINWLLTRVLFRSPRLSMVLEGSERVLIRHGVVDWAAAKKEALTELELRSVLHKQGFTDFAEVEKCVLEPNGNFYMEGIKAMSDDAQRADLMREIKALAVEVRELKGMLAARE
ncbi:MAG TPA: YetF domain-containing protein [Edaphobacter sp.]